MFKKVAIALLSLLPVTLMAQSEMKIGYVNTQEIIPQMAQYKDAQAQVQKMSKEFDDELGKLNSEGQQKLKEFQDLQNSKADEAILKNRADELQALDQRIKLFQQNAQEQLQKKQEALMSPIIDQVKKAITLVGAENNFSYIMDANALLYQSPKSEDVTPLIKKKLNITATSETEPATTNVAAPVPAKKGKRK